ncbi:MAG: sulfite exporter TauE/SafE family protein [Saprospiraceae bacterium]|nr:sulfite exporter TauE/SafE family protein [Saprospiraceae bacterium]MBK8451339.1 sulfite exporter TauE/SafE family protein [Saprospiraceae bacterium]MBK8483296.1 sulfite exporter TauE/SafE family protein [Saprospiraceae bacterium]MBK9220808.1 sulfite exporter TauE/SafE family protein [Saprospiraceae bacterium]MBK9722347.1 sulfite exporter TauE/SafE family protein [Saprospiraceae bacterium]
MSLYEISFAIIGGFIAGCINTLAGNGSVITLGFLTEVMGLPGGLANGTNRVGIVVQGLTSLQAFKKAGKIPLASSWKFLIWGVAGAIFGTLVAVRISANGFTLVYKFLLLALFVFMVFHRKKLSHSELPEITMSPWIYIPMFFAFGFYGGFIQMGMGIFLLAFMVFYMRYPILEANALKILMVSGYTLIALCIFHYFGMVNWKIGLTIAIGQGLGGWLTAHYANKIPNAETWAYRFLICIMIFTLLKLFGFLNWLFTS